MTQKTTAPTVHLLPLSNAVQPEAALAVALEGNIFACDLYISGAETFSPETWGYRQGRLFNIDHHAPVSHMSRHISSANLAIAYVEANGPARAGDCVVLNHTDCDSVLSGAIVAGDLPTAPELGAAAIAADHTGQEDPIADLLQAVDELRDYEFSLRNLRLLLRGAALESVACKALQARESARKFAASLVDRGKFGQVGGLAFTVMENDVDGEFFLPMLPAAVAILIITPRHEPGRWNAKIRLGNAAPEGLSLHHLNIGEFDPDFGGRWNAGSNKRGVGTSISPEAYAAEVSARLQSLLVTNGVPGQ